MTTSVEQLLNTASDFYSESTFMKKDHLKHGEIVAYQQLSAAEVMHLFSKLGVSQGAQLFWLMLQSYMIVTRAANAGWEFTKKLDAGDSKGAGEALAGLRRALHDYAPEHFSPNVGDLEFAADSFEQFYDEASKTKSREEMEELVFTWTQKFRDAAQERRSERTTVEDVLALYQARKC